MMLLIQSNQNPSIIPLPTHWNGFNKKYGKYQALSEICHNCNSSYSVSWSINSLKNQLPISTKVKYINIMQPNNSPPMYMYKRNVHECVPKKKKKSTEYMHISTIHNHPNQKQSKYSTKSTDKYIVAIQLNAIR